MLAHLGPATRLAPPRLATMSQQHHYTTRSNGPFEGDRDRYREGSRWRRGEDNQANDERHPYTRQPLADQDSAWRGGQRGQYSGGPRGGGRGSSWPGHTGPRGAFSGRHDRHDGHGGAPRAQRDDSLWSTGDYRPLRPRAPRGRGPSRSPSPPPHATSGNTTPERRQKLHQRTAPLPKPSQAYLDAASIPSNVSPSPLRDPPILILDLNHTLLCRSERNRAGSKVPLVRPYLSSFLEYITSPRAAVEGAATPRFVPVVFSSARYRNVLSLLVALGLVPPHRLPPPPPPRNRYGAPPPPPVDLQRVDQPTTYTCEESEGDVLKLVWTRENMGLNARDFGGDVETVKDLDGVWKALRLGTSSSMDGSVTGEEEARNVEGARRTILLDDEVSKAAQQPYSLLPIKPFLLTPRDFPPVAHLQPNAAPDLAPSAVELATADHPAWSDKTLLSITYQLDVMSRWDNVSYEIRHGGFERIRSEVRRELEARNGRERSEEEVEHEMERRGEKLIKAAGIDVKKEWDCAWRERVVDKLRRGGV